jgi:hypothetical protein
MKPSITLSIEKPCSENWNSFTATTRGGFCGSCQKEVIDFTQMSDDEVMRYFEQRHGHVCGRFSVHQLKTYKRDFVKVNPGWKLFAASVVSSVLLLSSKSTFAQQSIERNAVVLEYSNHNSDVNEANEVVVKGRVLDEEGLPLPGVNVWIQGKEIETVTDVNGVFEISKSLRVGTTLNFSFIGYETKQYVINDSQNFSVSMVISMEMDQLVMMGEVAVVGEKPSMMQRVWRNVKHVF